MEADSRARARAFTEISNTLHQPLHAAAAADGQLNNSKPGTQQRRAKLVVCTSGFRGAAVKQEFVQLASQFGAAYSGELVQGHTTHLVCKRLIDCFATPKYQRALEWGVHIVSYEWLLASAAAGQAVQEQDYKDDALDALKPSPAPPARQQQHQRQLQREQGPLQAHLQLEAEQEQQLQCGWQQEDASAAALDPPRQQQQQQQALGQQHQKAVRKHEEAVRQQQHQQPQHQQPATAAGTNGSSNSLAFCAELPANFLLLGPESPISSNSGDAPCSSPMHASPSQLVVAAAGGVLNDAELPANFLLLGPESPVSSDGGDAPYSSPTHASPSDVVNRNTALCRQQQQQQQQQPLEQPSPLPQPAAAGVQERGFQFCMQLTSGSPQQNSPCMQSFLPMQQQQQQALLGTFVQQHAVSVTLAGSELQPDGVPDVPVLAPPPAAAAAAAAALGFEPETGAGASSPATVQAYHDKQQQEQQQKPQQQQQRPLLIPETQCEDLLTPPRCGTPESLAHYVNKQRRRQRAAAAAAAPVVQQVAQSMGHAAPVQTEPADCTAAGADAGSVVGADNACADVGAAEGGLVRLRRMGGCGAGVVSGASSPTPSDCADLEDSDCELEGSAGGSSSSPATTAAAEGAAGVAPVGDTSATAAVAAAATAAEGSAGGAPDADAATDLEDSDWGLDGATSPSSRKSDALCYTTDLLRDSYKDAADTVAGISCRSSSPRGTKAGRQQGRRLRTTAAAAAQAAAAAAAAVCAASANAGSSTQQESQEHVTPHADRRQGRHCCASPGSCSGSSLPSGPSSAAAAAYPADSDAAYYSVSGAAAGTAGAAAAAEQGASKQSPGGSESASLAGDTTCTQEADNSQGQMPVKRLDFSLGGHPSTGSSTADRHQQTPAHTQQQQQQEQQQEEGEEWAGLEEEGGRAGESEGSEDETQCTGSGAGWSPAANSEATSGSGSSSSGGDSSKRSTGSSTSSSRLRLRPGSAAAAAGRTAAALLQKRQQLKQQQRDNSMNALDGRGLVRHQFTASTPPSEGSLFVTRRKAPRPAAGPAATAAAASGASDSEDGTAVDGSVLQCRRAQRPSAAPSAATADSSEEEEDVWESDSHSKRGGGGAAVAGAVLPAEQLLQDLKQQHQQGVAGGGAALQLALEPASEPQQEQEHHKQWQQKDSPAESFLRDLQRQQQQQGSVHESTSAITDFPQPPLAAAAAAGPKQPRHSVSSSCAGPQLSTASRKVPLQLQGGAIELQGISSSTASSSCISAAGSSGEDGLTKALQQALAAATAAAGSSAAARSSAPAIQQQRQQLPESAEAVCLDKQQQQQAGEQAGQEQEVAGGAVSWLHTPEGPQQQQQQQDLDLVGMPTVGVEAQGAAMSKHLGARLAQLSQTHEEVVPLKLLQKAPRGSTAKAHHGLKPGSKLTYADQVQVPWAHATLSTKERSRCVIVAGSSGSTGSNGGCSSGSSAAAFIGEPVAFYRLPSGDWWVELLRFYSAKDLRELAKGCGQAVHLPPDFQLSYELLRGMSHEHWPMRQVQGEFKLSKVCKAPTGTRSRAPSPFFWRYSVDTTTCQLLTDRPVTDLVVQ